MGVVNSYIFALKADPSDKCERRVRKDDTNVDAATAPAFIRTRYGFRLKPEAIANRLDLLPLFLDMISVIYEIKFIVLCLDSFFALYETCFLLISIGVFRAVLSRIYHKECFFFLL